MDKRPEQLSGPNIIAYCGRNAARWAEVFCTIKEAEGWTAKDIDEDLMVGWFANAIEGASCGLTRDDIEDPHPRDSDAS